MSKYKFNFLTASINKGSLASVLPFGAGQLDYSSFKKNIPHFEETALQFGLNNLKGAILKNTFKFFQTRVATDGDNPLTPVSQSVFGTPVYSNLHIIGDSYTDNQQKVIGTFYDVVADAVIMEVNRDNNVITTDLQGRDNSVIEYISKKSWRINVKGRILSQERDVYPRMAVDNLITALDANKSLAVTSWYLNMCSIYNIVIMKKSFPQEEGSQEYQRFEFDAIADSPVILKIKV
jgi:hypothetical protein